ncbi:endonuclease domain-containing protein [Sphingosinicella terrae]|uniref:endonuclease domain-containing protein n=1 Tax=Sphingosinicella terrae TaxID=2172047 RepID=UPI000E0CEF02|nr:DUF559 domain-containing protein [Sphingosinicella terrae]
MNKIERARQFRRSMSPPEVILWQHLRSRPGGFKFRRQRPLGPYFADFYCRSAGVVIEVDGCSHDMGDNPARDQRRDDWMAEKRILTLRFPAAEIMTNIEGVSLRILEVCASRTPSTGSAGPPPRQRPGRK